MDRRDFLHLWKQPRNNRLELSGRWLYMRCLDTEVTGHSLEPPPETDMQHGEPAAAFHARSTRQLFDDLDRQLRNVNMLHVTDMQWLTGDLQREFGDLLRIFRARGGTVQIDY